MLRSLNKLSLHLRQESEATKSSGGGGDKRKDEFFSLDDRARVKLAKLQRSLETGLDRIGLDRTAVDERKLDSFRRRLQLGAEQGTAQYGGGLLFGGEF